MGICYDSPIEKGRVVHHGRFGQTGRRHQVEVVFGGGGGVVKREGTGEVGHCHGHVLEVVVHGERDAW